MELLRGWWGGVDACFGLVTATTIKNYVSIYIQHLRISIHYYYYYDLRE